MLIKFNNFETSKTNDDHIKATFSCDIIHPINWDVANKELRRLCDQYVVLTQTAPFSKEIVELLEGRNNENKDKMEHV